MLMRSFADRWRASIPILGMLTALALWDCSAEAPSPPALTSPPKLAPLVDDGGCLVDPAYKAICVDGPKPIHCCCDLATAYLNGCGDHPPLCCAMGAEICLDNTCITLCTTDDNCKRDDAYFICSTEHTCVKGCKDDSECEEKQACVERKCKSVPCSSNRACDDGQVCEADAGVCVSAIQDEPDPGCSAAGAGTSSGILITALSALTLACARARRRRRAR